MKIRSYFFVNDSVEIYQVLEQERESFTNRDFKQVIHRLMNNVLYDEEIKHILCVTMKENGHTLFVAHADILYTTEYETYWSVTIERLQDKKEQRLRVFSIK